MNDLFNNQVIDDSPVSADDSCFDSANDQDAASMMRQKRERYIQDTGHRHTLIVWMMMVVSFWLIAVILIVSLNGRLSLGINDTVLVTLMATTTANVLGLPLIILKDLFKGLVQ